MTRRKTQPKTAKRSDGGLNLLPKRNYRDTPSAFAEQERRAREAGLSWNEWVRVMVRKA